MQAKLSFLKYFQGISSLYTARLARRKAAAKLEVVEEDWRRERDDATRSRVLCSKLKVENKNLMAKNSRLTKRLVRAEAELRMERNSSSSNGSSRRGVDRGGRGGDGAGAGGAFRVGGEGRRAAY